MRYLTARKRAEGKGAARSGTEHQWYMSTSSVALAFMVPTIVYIFGSALGRSHADVLATFSSPFVAILMGLTLFIGMRHFAKGAQMAIEDYARGTARKLLVLLVLTLSYLVTAVGLFALAKIAL